MKMNKLMAISLGIGIPCFVWPLVAGLINPQVTWMGFVGCTAFYASGAGKAGAIKGLCGAMTGMLWAMLVISFGGLGFMASGGFIATILGALATGFIAFTMTYQSKLPFLAIIPATFMGCFSTFASGGNWKLMMISIPMGVVLGICCQLCGDYLYKTFGDGKE